MEFKIPYQNMGGKVDELGLLNMVREAIVNKKELPYWKLFAENGQYRKWISTIDDATLEGFIVKHEATMNEMLSNTFIPPSIVRAQSILNQIALYQVELYLRDSEDTDQLDSDLHDYQTLWLSRFNRFIESFHEPEEAPPENDGRVSGPNPYY